MSSRLENSRILSVSHITLCVLIKSSLPPSQQRSDTVIKNSNTKNNNATDTEPDTPSSAVSVVSYLTDMKRVKQAKRSLCKVCHIEKMLQCNYCILIIKKYGLCNYVPYFWTENSLIGSLFSLILRGFCRNNRAISDINVTYIFQSISVEKASSLSSTLASVLPKKREQESELRQNTVVEAPKTVKLPVQYYTKIRTLCPLLLFFNRTKKTF